MKVSANGLCTASGAIYIQHVRDGMYHVHDLHTEMHNCDMLEFTSGYRQRHVLSTISTG